MPGERFPRETSSALTFCDPGTPEERMRGDVAFSRTPYPFPTTDRGVLRTIGDARDYMLALSKERERRADWQHACRLLMEEAGVPQ